MKIFKNKKLFLCLVAMMAGGPLLADQALPRGKFISQKQGEVFVVQILKRRHIAIGLQKKGDPPKTVEGFHSRPRFEEGVYKFSVTVSNLTTSKWPTDEVDMFSILIKKKENFKARVKTISPDKIEFCLETLGIGGDPWLQCRTLTGKIDKEESPAKSGQ